MDDIVALANEAAEAAPPDNTVDEQRETFGAARIDGWDDLDSDTKLQEITRSAKAVGWKDKGEFKGDPDKAREDIAFLMYSFENHQMTRADFKALNATNKDKDARIEKLEKAMTIQTKAFEANQAVAIANVRKEYATKIDDAIDDGDKSEVHKLTKERDEAVAETRPKEEAQSNPADDAAVAKFAEDNIWYGYDKDMTEFTKAQSGKVYAANPGLTVEQNLDQVLINVKAKFPERFATESKPAPPPSIVAKGKRIPGGVRKKAETFDSLPPDLKNAAKAAVSFGWNKDVEEFAKAHYTLEKQKGQ